MAGAKIANQVLASKPGKPDSAIVGNSGASLLRLALVTAMALSLPALACGITATGGTQANCTSPCMMASTASGDEA